MVPPLIALEEHFLSESGLKAHEPKYSQQRKFNPGILDRLRDLGSIRLRHMDAGVILVQVVSHAPGMMTPAQCTIAKNELAEAVSKQPQRFAGCATLPVSNPARCATELTRCVRELGFVGALIDNHADGTHYETEAYYPLWEAAQSFNVPIYLHPTWPTDSMQDLLYRGNIPESASISLGTSGFRWHSDVAVHVLKVFAAGIFDRFPKIRIILGHMGEMLPFMLGRIVMLSPRWGRRERSFDQVYRTNIWITTSGYWSVDPVACILRNTEIEHILYSVDYPFGTNEDGLRFMQDLENSGLVTAEELEMIAHRNAEKLLGVRLMD